MGTSLKNMKGQGVMVHYALTFAVVLTVAMAMGVYVRRAVQSRYRGVNDYAAKQIRGVFTEGQYNLAGQYALEYEPYYSERTTERETRGAVIDRSTGGVGQAEIYGREYAGYETRLKVSGNQLPPKDAD